MAYYRKWKPSKTRAREFARTMTDLEHYCDLNDIGYSSSMDSYYFTVNGVDYRVSNHTIAASDRGMYKQDTLTGNIVKVRESYHDQDKDSDLVCIFASKTRIREIHEKLLKGYKLDGRGYIIS